MLFLQKCSQGSGTEQQEQRSGTPDHELGLIMNIDHELTLPDSIQTIIGAYISQHKKDYVTKCIIKITEIIVKRTQQSPFLEKKRLSFSLSKIRSN